MLPTQELFRAIPCPYYVAGLCERPHCFFRHTKSDVLVARKSSTELVEEAVNSSDDDEKSSTNSENPSPKKVSVQDSENGCSTSAELKKDSIPKPVHTDASVSAVPEVPDAVPVDRSKRVATDSLESETKKTKLSDSITTRESYTVDKGSIVLSKLEDKKSPGKRSPKKSKQLDEPEHSKPSKFTLLLESLTPSDDKADNTTAPEITSSRPKTSHSHNTHKHESTKASSRSSSSKSSSKHKSKTSHEKDASSSSKKRQSSKSSSSKSHVKSTPEKKHNSSSSKSSSRSNKDKLRHNSKEKHNKEDKKANNLKTDAKDVDYLIEEISDYQDSNRKTQEQFNLPVITDYDDDPDDIAMECLRMFEDYQPAEPPENKTLATNLQHNIFTNKFEHPPDNTSNQSSLKRRTAHAGAENRVNSILINQPPPKKAMVDLTGSLISRYQSHLNQATRDPDGEPTPAQTLSVSTGRKSRIAHVPNVSGLMRPSSHQQQQHTRNGGVAPSESSSAKSSSNGQSGASGKARPSQTQDKKPVARRPSVFVDAVNKKGGKVPLTIRQYGMDKLFDAYLQAFPDGDEALKRSITDEDDILGRCSSKPVYMSLIAAAVGRIRRESQQITSSLGCTVSGQPIVSHDQMVNGPLNNCSIIRAPRISAAPSGKELYAAFSSYLLTESQLTDNGFPRPNPSGEAGRAIATSSRNLETWARSLTTRTCDRCLKGYVVDIEGNPIEDNTCVYHPGKIGRKRIGRTLVKIYNCCSGSTEENEIGCLTVPFHVPKSLPVSQRRGFVSAVREAGNDSEMGSDPWDIVALDCEMVYTTEGMELARATFVGQDNKILYDEIVKPTHRLLDPITHYSGLTEDDLNKATVTFSEVQAVMLTHLKPNSILIGHSLESDLLALKVLHSCVIDTSVLFPHKDTTYKRALRNLASEYLRKIIQDSTEGHDSAEDARTALALVFYKLAEDRKSKIRT